MDSRRKGTEICVTRRLMAHEHVTIWNEDTYVWHELRVKRLSAASQVL
jgi:hypothetical protein